MGIISLQKQQDKQLNRCELVLVYSACLIACQTPQSEDVSDVTRHVFNNFGQKV